MRSLLIEQRGGLAYEVCLTSLVRDLHAQVGDRFRLHVKSKYAELWHGQPWVNAFALSEAKDLEDYSHLLVDYASARTECLLGRKRKHAVVTGYDQASEILGTPITCMSAAPYVSLFDEEVRERPIAQRYWLASSEQTIAEGVRAWPASCWRELGLRFAASSLALVQVGREQATRINEPIPRAINRVGRTSLRDLLVWLHHAEGVICAPGALVHLAAAFAKPCVVLAGGSEPPVWMHYTDKNEGAINNAPFSIHPHRWVGAIGTLDCCAVIACGKKHLDRSGELPEATRCVLPTIRLDGDKEAAACVSQIAPARVWNEIQLYYQQGALPPLGEHREEERRERRIVFGHMRGEPSYTKLYPSKRLTFPVDPMSSAIVGEKFTVFVLLYGPYTTLARRCLDGILDTTTPNQIDLRIGANCVCPETKEYLDSIGHRIQKVYWQENPAEAVKYPLMRQMFRDPELPIETNYLIWFDDDSKVHHPDWMLALADNINKNHLLGYRIYGPTIVRPVIFKEGTSAIYYPPRGASEVRALENRKKEVAWMRRAEWHHGRPLRTRAGYPSADKGDSVIFVAGSFWALATHLILEADIPDRRLRHLGGDITISEQVYQAGFKPFGFNKLKTFVKHSAAARRGDPRYPQQYAWLEENP